MKFYCDEARHLVCVPYSIGNLHRMAEMLGIKRCWYHAGRHPHYDIPKRREESIKRCCEIVSSAEIHGIIHRFDGVE